MLERDVRRLHMETIIQLPMQLLMSVQRRLGCCKNQIATGTNLLALMASQVSDAFNTKTRVKAEDIWNGSFLPSAKDLDILPKGKK